MAGVIVVFPKADDVKSIRNLLIRNGYEVSAACTNGAQALSAADRLGAGVIVCGYKYPDMMYEELYENLSPSFAMLLIASARAIGEGVAEGVVSVTMPLKVHELTGSLDMVLHQIERRKKKRRAMPPQRSDQDRKDILEAKQLLMERNHNDRRRGTPLSAEDEHGQWDESGRNRADAADVDGSINLGVCFRMKKLCKMETYADGNGDSMKFTKMHGIGNDYVYVNCFTEQVRDPEQVSCRISDRHFGIGSDGLVLIRPSSVADFKMEIYNADGSRAKNVWKRDSLCGEVCV